MVLLIEGIFAVMLNSVMADLWRFDLAHSLSLGVFVLCNYLCVLHALVSFYLSVGFQKNAIFSLLVVYVTMFSSFAP